MKQKLSPWIYQFTILVVFILIISSCKEDPEPLIIPPDSIADIDENIYKTVTIGSQVWMAENLRVTHYRNGDEITALKQISWQNAEEGACCDLNDHPANTKTFGKLYNGFAVQDSRNIAPEGWHIPSNEEWLTLIEYLGGQMVAGGKLKDTSISWMKPNIGATNESGFSALPGGCRTVLYVDDQPYYMGYFWSITERDSAYMYFLSLSNKHTYTGGLTSSYYKMAGLSVRCVKD